MKKLFALFLALVCVFSLCLIGCGKTETPDGTKPAADGTKPSATQPTTAPTVPTTQPAPTGSSDPTGTTGGVNTMDPKAGLPGGMGLIP